MFVGSSPTAGSPINTPQMLMLWAFEGLFYWVCEVLKNSLFIGVKVRLLKKLPKNYPKMCVGFAPTAVH